MTYRLDSLVYSGWSEAMPDVGKPDMKNGWQVVKVLKMEKHPRAQVGSSELGGKGGSKSFRNRG